jgi:uncharacterized protein YdhG (YjbR/CyaY superfamily)
MKLEFSSINEYIAQCPPAIQEKLEAIRMTIEAVAPEAKEAIKYGLPTYVYHGNLVHFAAFQKHIGFYPGASGVAAFANQLKGYTCSKGAIQFPLNQEPPLDLIAEIVAFRVQENLELKQAKKA